MTSKPNEIGGADGRQPFRSVAFRRSVAAASRRSPRRSASVETMCPSRALDGVGLGLTFVAPEVLSDVLPALVAERVGGVTVHEGPPIAALCCRPCHFHFPLSGATPNKVAAPNGRQPFTFVLFSLPHRRLPPVGELFRSA